MSEKGSTYDSESVFLSPEFTDEALNRINSISDSVFSVAQLMIDDGQFSGSDFGAALAYLLKLEYSHPSNYRALRAAITALSTP